VLSAAAQLGGFRLTTEERKLRDWNLLVTVVPGPRHVRQVLDQLGRLGWFKPSSFKDVCIGQVDDVARFLETVRSARANAEGWANLVARVIPLQRIFTFTPESFADKLKEAVAPFVEAMRSGSFYVRVERRGLAGKIPTQQVERAVADHLFGLAQAHGIHLATDFENPDYVVVAETLGEQCGVALITRELSTHYPFVQAR
jgi:tRNA(Ser,Leu) C12 N-acetylase TAN1